VFLQNGKSRHIGNIGYTRDRAKTNKAKYTTQKTKKMRNTDTPKPHGKQFLLYKTPPCYSTPKSNIRELRQVWETTHPVE
jgi:hypothetical protein